MAASTLKDRLPVDLDTIVYTHDVFDANSQRLRMYRENETTILSLKHEHTCVVCSFPFTQEQNLQGYFCTVHIGKLHYDGRWTCCRRFEGSVGCRPAMHAVSKRIAFEMKIDPSQSRLELPSDLVDYRFIDFNRKMIVNPERPEPSITDSYNRQVTEYYLQKPEAIDAAVSAGLGPLRPSKLFYFFPRVAQK